MPTMEELLDFAYSKEKEYVYADSQRGFDCLIYLIEDKAIVTWEELANYGIEKETTDD